MRRLAAGVAGLALAGAGLTGCGGQPPASGVTSSGGSCARLGAAGHLALARVVVTGTMLAGQTAEVNGRPVLVSPARVRVTRYLKGSGPDLISVVTGVTREGHAVNADGIDPLAGQRWTIYTRSRRMPYQTSICDGSRVT